MTAVIAQHCGLLPFGWTGVWLFFVISGFVVTLSTLGRANAAPAGERLRAFFSRRVRRIVPVCYLYVFAGLVFMLATGKPVEWLAVGSLLGFFNNVAMIAGRGELDGWPVGHLWTISVEMQFYLVYGLALVLASRRVLIGTLFGALLVTPVLRAVVSAKLSGLGWSPEAIAYAIYAGPFLHVDAFAVGALLAFASRSGLLPKLARPLALAGIAGLVAYAATYVCLNHALVGADGVDALRNVVSGILWGQHREIFVYSVIAIASGGLVSLTVIGHPAVAWLVRHPLLQRIGETSYGGYVYHALAIAIAIQPLAKFFDVPVDEAPIVARLALFVCAYALTIAMAELSYRYFEKRFFARRSAATPARAGAA